MLEHQGSGQREEAAIKTFADVPDGSDPPEMFVVPLSIDARGRPAESPWLPALLQSPPPVLATLVRLIPF